MARTKAIPYLIRIPHDLRDAAQQAADREGIVLAEFVRLSIWARCRRLDIATTPDYGVHRRPAGRPKAATD